MTDDQFNDLVNTGQQLTEKTDSLADSIATVDFKVEKVAILELRSHAAWYLKGIKGMNEYKKEFFKATTKDDVLKIIKEIKDNEICQFFRKIRSLYC